MQIYSYWTRSAVDCTAPDGQPYHLIAYGGSDLSPADARLQAEQLLEKRWQRLQRDEELGHYPTGARPLREHLEQRLQNAQGNTTGAITRNGYGALVLNTSNVLFADVDQTDLVLPPRSNSKTTNIFVALLRRLGLLTTPPPVPAPPPLEGLPLLEARIKAWLATHPEWNFRLYRTRLGYRVLATHAEILPSDPTSQAVFSALDADAIYVRMCQRQQCYRARLSPKPWRIGLARPAHTFPYENEQQATAQAAWETQYAAQSTAFSVCELIGSYGSGRVCPAAEEIVAIHDAACLGGHPLA
ncbi:hypothetical protein [Hymenobacter sp. IS2118]|uniref:hypothetical protein n=1 Tax=Hymenobacter sp. IS2118 TaxID=1505605 RepID=UPI000556BDFE|nr:hypothetical protein [Hymenobacter sp. IS2118]